MQWHEVASGGDYEVSFGNGWGMRHHPLKVSTYSIFYNAGITVKEAHPLPGNEHARSKSFVCSYATDSDYYYDEVYNNKAAAVKEAMALAAPSCIKELRDEIHEEVETATKEGKK